MRAQTHEEQRQAVVFFMNVELQLVIGKTFDKSNVSAYWADVLRQPATAAHPPHWCGALALHCLHQADLLLDQPWKIGTPDPRTKHPNALRWGFCYRLEQLAPGVAPEPGDVGYIDKPNQHHFVVDHVDAAGVVHCIDGNQGNPPIAARQRKLGAKGVVYFSIAGVLNPEPVKPEPEPEVAA